MENLVGDTIGLIHLISSIFALIFGAIVLIMKKGTKKHKQIGYAITAEFSNKNSRLLINLVVPAKSTRALSPYLRLHKPISTTPKTF